MAAESYQIREYLEDGRLYVLVTLMGGRTFGQIIRPGKNSDMDAQVSEAAARVEAPAEVIQKPAIGAVLLLPVKV